MKLNPFMSNARNSGIHGQFHVGSVGRLATIILAVSSFISLSSRVSAHQQHGLMSSPNTNQNVNLGRGIGMSQSNESTGSFGSKLMRTSSFSSLSDNIGYYASRSAEKIFG